MVIGKQFCKWGCMRDKKPVLSESPTVVGLDKDLAYPPPTKPQSAHCVNTVYEDDKQGLVILVYTSFTAVAAATPQQQQQQRQFFRPSITTVDAASASQ